MDSKKINGRWFAGLDEEKAKEFEQYLLNSQKLLDKLHEICYNMYIESEKRPQNNYDNPNWAYMTADSVGYRRALSNIMSLLKIKEA